MHLQEILDELYAVLPEDFISTRNDRARAAREAGDRALAEEIKKLPKPSAAAWLVNMLVRHRRDEIDQVLELGAALRRAQQDLDSDRLRALSRERRDRVAAVLGTGRTLGTELGHPISASALAEAEQTLHAAMADPDAATAVLGGRLSTVLSSTGWGPVDLSAAAAVPAPAKGRAPTKGQPAAKDQAATKDQPRVARQPLAAKRRAELAQAKRASTAAERNRQRVEGDRADLQRRIDELGSRKTQLIADLAALREQVGDLERERRGVEDQSRFLSRERDQLDRAVDQARRDADRARRRLDRLQ